MNADFSVSLYQQLAINGGNICFSPWSIHLALTMIWAGARGATADEIAQALHLPHELDVLTVVADRIEQLKGDAAQSGIEFRSVDALWKAAGYPFMPAYLMDMEHTLGVHLSELDFAADPAAARSVINRWIADQTLDQVQDLFDPGKITPDTKLVLANAVFFRAGWEYRFDRDRTQIETFFVSAEQRLRVPLMYQQRSFRYTEDSTMQVVDLPYRNGLLAMRVFLPISRDGLGTLEAGLSAQRMAPLRASMGEQVMQLWLPRFKLENRYDLIPMLSALGIRHAFDRADFSGMSPVGGLSVSDVIHQALVHTHEEGTEAAAATAVQMRGGVLLPQPGSRIFRADHPFLFAIVHQPTDSILFMGRVSEPA